MFKTSEIERKSLALLNRHGIKEPPVDVLKLIEAEEIELSFEEMDDEHSGFLLVEDGLATIAINGDHHPNRQRFTAAHELGHWMLHSQGTDRLFVDTAPQAFLRDQVSSQGTTQVEIDANRFAASLLMPKTLLKKAVGKGADQITDLDIYRLASRFEVSEQAMTLRLGQLFKSAQ